MRIVYAISLLLLSSCGSKTVTEEVQRLRPVKFITVNPATINEEHTFSGTAQAPEEANLSFKVAGTINRIHVKVGDVVRNGQVLASLEATDYNVSLKQAKAQEEGAKASQQSSETQIKSAEANYIAARSAYQRITKLYENNSVSLSEFEQSKANYEAARASFDAAQSQYKAAQFNTTASLGQTQSAENQVSYTVLKAPFSGVISQQFVEENELVVSGNPVLTISSLGKPEVVVGVPEVLISRVKKGMMTNVSFSTIPGSSFEAVVLEVGYSPGSGSTYPVTVDLITSDENIRPGMPANVSFLFELPEQLSEAIVVPAAAVGEDSEGRFVFLLEDSEDQKLQVRRRAVEIGKMRNTGFEIISGLSPGEKIASAGLNVLQDGDQVRPFDSTH